MNTAQKALALEASQLAASGDMPGYGEKLGEMVMASFERVDTKEDHLAIAIAMIQYGGGFIKHLGHALFHADADNVAKIKATWPDEWETYKAFAARMDKEEGK